MNMNPASPYSSCFPKRCADHTAISCLKTAFLFFLMIQLNARVIAQTSNPDAGTLPVKAWSLSGTSGTAYPKNFLGTTDSVPLSIQANKHEAILINADGSVKIAGVLTSSRDIVTTGSLWATTLLSNKLLATANLELNTGVSGHTLLNVQSAGNVGVGLSQPVFKLDVAGKIHTNSSLLVDSNLVIKGNFETKGGLNFGVNKTIAYIPARGSNPEIFLFGDSANPARSSLRSIQPQPLFCGSAALTTINGFNGTLVCGGYDATKAFHPLTLGFDGANGMIEFGGSQVLGPGGTTAGLLINYYCGRSVAICTGKSGGNVALCTGGGGGRVYLGPTHIGTQVQTAGTANADAILTVSGKMVAQSCFVSLSNWVDYVFESTYKLPLLKDVERFYLKEKHLPDVPSENEVKQNGADLGKMDVLLLKKVEELTLYIVEQNKRIEEMEKRMRGLERK